MDQTKDQKTFKEKYSLDERKKELEKQKAKYSAMIPVIVECHKKTKGLKPLQKTKFLVSQDVKLCEFQQTVRKKIDLNSNDALFFFVGKNQLKSPTKQMKEVYHESKDPEDGFLYIIYCDYDPFGTD